MTGRAYGSKFRTVNMNLSKEQLKVLDRVARKEMTSRSQVVRSLLKQHLKDEDEPRN